MKLDRLNLEYQFLLALLALNVVLRDNDKGLISWAFGGAFKRWPIGGQS
jgi:hypothetical protein